MGDIDLEFSFKVKGRQDVYLIWHWGAPQKATQADRAKTRVANYNRTTYGRINRIMDLKADQKVTARPLFTDEEGNPTGTPADFTASYTTDRPDLVTVTDNGDGSVTFAATGGTGNLGEARIHGEATFGGKTAQADDIINVVAGDAERFTLAFGDPEEVDSDDTTGGGETDQPPAPEPEQ